MKTTEQIKSEVVNYLNKTSNHLFVKTNGDFYKVLVEGDNFIVIDGNKVNVYNINEHITWYGNNTKCVIKHKLFLIPSYTSTPYPGGNLNKLKSIKNFKTMREKFSKIKESIAGKTDKNEITKLVTQELTGVVVAEEKKSFINKLFGK